MKPQVLVVTRISFWLLGAGERMRLLAMLWVLGAHVRLTVLFLGHLQPADVQRIRQLGLTCDLVQLEGAEDVAHQQAALRQLCTSRAFDACIFERIELHFLLDVLPPGIQSVLDTHDLESVNSDSRQAAGTPSERPVSVEAELAILSRFDRVLLIQAQDHALVARHLGHKALLVPHPVSFARLPVHPERHCLGLVGSAWAANLHGLDWFADEVWPRINPAQAEVHLFGWIGDHWRPAHTGFHRHGFVADFKQAWGAIDVAINPVRWGSGLKIKSVEAMGHGLPLVTTSEGARGLQAAGHALVIADDPSEFATACTRLLSDPIQRFKLGEAAWTYTRDHFSPQVCFAPFVHWLNEIRASKEPVHG